ncbi:hypothetical protein [Streptomyces sp. NPDC127066]|uniref:hypothetical protein n=1 Tax=Streptomyces sp. NPDC127066 TaxID=3347125 RepID=UPI0036598814
MTRSPPGILAGSIARPSWRDSAAGEAGDFVRTTVLADSAAGEAGTFVDVPEKTTHAFRDPYPARTHTRFTPMTGSR